MASIFNILSITLFFALVFQVYGHPCSLSDIQVSQSKTSATRYNVSVTNHCICSQSKIRFNCHGFKSSQPVDPKIFSKSCLLIQGAPLYLASVVTFTYDSDSRFLFVPISSQISCH
ncbi:unnamed protein product [Vicia faba]|uniref:Uncharacterized protein n=1 Tax=Vicia faba TaxID=3906 RepID=A0AAV0Z0I0_VICFA|nr:unnamed protein product [Vicia faba]